MANVNHKDLTGVALHEPKGVASATADQVYVADGAASGAWTDLHPKVAQYQWQESDTTNGTSPFSSDNTWTKVTLNTEVQDEDTISSVSSSVITVAAAGTYVFRGFVQVGIGNGAKIKLRLRNTSDGTTVAVGTYASSVTSTGSDFSQLSVSGTETVAATKNYELQAITDSRADLTFDHDGMTGGVEVYAELWIEKIR